MNFDDIIRIGIDKNGEVDFRISMKIASLDREKYRLLIEMIPWATAEAVRIYRDHGPGTRSAVTTPDDAPN